MASKREKALYRRSYTSLGKGTKISPKYPVLAVFLFLLSLFTAVGHHLYYRRLDGRLAQPSSETAETTGVYDMQFLDPNTGEQVFALRVGNTLVFLHRAGLAALLSLVATQQVWATLRNKAMSVGAIDKMFSIMGDPISLFNTEVLLNAKVLVLLAVIAWTWPPVVSVITPPTLSVIPKLQSKLGEAAVPTVNFSDSSQWSLVDSDRYIMGPSIDASTMFTKTYSSSSFVPMTPPSINASYEQTFYGPSYKCLSLEEAIGSGYPIANLSSRFFNDLGLAERTARDDQAPVIYAAASPEDLNATIFIAANGSNPLWKATSTSNPIVGSAFLCQLYNTSFHVSIRFVNGKQLVVPLAIDYLQPQNWASRLGRDALIQDDLDDGKSAVRRVATHYVTHLLFEKLLVTSIVSLLMGGDILSPAGAYNITTAIPFLQSTLANCADVYNSTQFLNSGLATEGYDPQPGLCRNGTLAAAIEDLSRNFTYSMLTFRGWASHVDTVNMTTQESRIFFTYNWHILAASYSVSLFVGVIALGIGAHALFKNGVVGGVSFSTALVTTRNPQLDDIVRQSREILLPQPVGSEQPQVVEEVTSPGKDGLGHVRLRFGHIQPDGQNGLYAHTGFGIEGSVDPL